MQGVNEAGPAAALRDAARRFPDVRADDSEERTSPWIRAVEEIVELARALNASQWDDLVGREPEILALRTAICPLYGRYLRAQEMAEARRLLGRLGQHPGPGIEEGGDFAREAYTRVADMFDFLDFSACRRFVMIGSGPLPVTLLHVVQRTRVPEIIGVDLDADAIEAAQQLVRKLGYADRIRIERHDGSGYGFTSAGMVYVANLVMPKANVLRQIAQTAPPGTSVVLRNPYAAGHLLAEDGTVDLDARFEVLRWGNGNARFLSRHVFLRLR